MPLWCLESQVGSATGSVKAGGLQVILCSFGVSNEFILLFCGDAVDIRLDILGELAGCGCSASSNCCGSVFCLCGGSETPREVVLWRRLGRCYVLS